MNKKLLSIVLTIIMVASLLPAGMLGASAGSQGPCGENLTYVLDDTGVLTISGTGDMTDYTLTTPTWSICNSITSIKIDDGVTSIGNNAFSDCTALTSVTISNSVTKIGSSAFSGCTGLTYILIPNSVTEIGSSAFSGCTGLAYITIPNSVTEIGDRAFSGCAGLTSVVISENIDAINNSAFYGCSKLNSITIPDGVTSIGNGAFQNCTHLSRINIPTSVSSIGSFAFYNCPGLKSINIPDGIKTIDIYTFYFSGLTSVTLPDSVTEISSYAFCHCTGLTDINLKNVKILGNEAFHGCALKHADLDSAEHIGKNAFTSLHSVSLGKNVQIIYTDAFRNLSTLYYNIDSAPSVQSSWVSRNLQTIIFGDQVESISENFFKNYSNLKSVIIPETVESIGTGAFTGCHGDLIIYGKDSSAAKTYAVTSGIRFKPDTTEFTVKFFGKDGSYQIGTNQKVKVGCSATAPTPPLENGYRFIDWNKSFKFVTSDLDITAQYRKTYTVTFKAWDGITTLSEQVVLSGYPAKVPTNTYRAGYSFSHWEDEEGHRIDNFSGIMNDITVKAIYNINPYRVEFLGGKDGKRTIKTYDDITPGNCVNETPSKDDVKAVGKSFFKVYTGRWLDDNGNVVDFQTKTIDSNNIKFHAEYKGWFSYIWFLITGK